MIQFNDLSKQYGDTTILKNINLSVERGEFLVLLGASGSGKTTLLKMINGLIAPTSGQVSINGKPTVEQDLEQLRRSIGYVIQAVGLFPHYSVAQNIGLLPKLKGHKKEVVDQIVRQWMERLNLSYEKHAHKHPAQLSGGQAQRVGLARAMAGAPELMLMDEPFSALDPLIRTKIRRDYRAIQAKEGITTVMVTHDVLEAVEMADKICLIADGEIQQLDTPEGLIYNPANQKVIDFLASDRYQASLAVCKMNSLLRYAPQLGAHLTNHASLLEALSSANSSEELILMKAFGQYKAQWNE